MYDAKGMRGNTPDSQTPKKLDVSQVSKLKLVMIVMECTLNYHVHIKILFLLTQQVDERILQPMSNVF